jgi:hypothetical protein
VEPVVVPVFQWPVVYVLLPLYAVEPVVVPVVMLEPAVHLQIVMPCDALSPHDALDAMASQVDL